MSKLKLFSIFHLNLMYSSVEEESRAQIVEKCYWPLVRLSKKHNLPFGIEISGYTLEAASKIDPEWLKEIRSLVNEGSCELIGSGYAQIIGPLVPAEVNSANLRIGNQVYKDLLGIRPGIALVNEQAYSAGLLSHYLDNDYKAIVMEWDNPSRFHPEWSQELRYLPQICCGQNGEEIPLLWNKSIAFQKFQRYAHREIELDEYIRYLSTHFSESSRAMSLYGNDVEVFDFRPGRYHTEAELIAEKEWARIERFFDTLNRDERFHLVLPSEVLEMMSEPEAGNRLCLESPESPIPVKKQGKYNITRWAVTGRDDLGINTVCNRICARMKAASSATLEDWKELCYLWSSDFRTHITEKRLGRYRDRLQTFSEKWEKKSPATIDQRFKESLSKSGITRPAECGRLLDFETQDLSITLNRARGLTIERLCFKASGSIPQVVTLPHGYFDDISLGADWYTGHLVHESPGQPKVTDLNPTEPLIEQNDNVIRVSGMVSSLLGPIEKGITISRLEPLVEVAYSLKWETVPMGIMRLGHITLNPGAFDRETLYFKTHNGGVEPETFPISGHRIEHGSPVSFLVSAESGFGLTEGLVEIGDAETQLLIETDKTQLAVMGLLTYREIGESFFCRVTFSAGELDDTRQEGDTFSGGLSFSFRISSHKHH